MLLIPLDQSLSTPLYEQIYQYMKAKISDGTLACGSKLPSSRVLAEQLTVSRSTVNSAYEQLLSEGYIYAKEKSGYFVADVSFSTSLEQYSNHVESPVIVKKDKKITYSFSPFAIDTELFPYTIWRKLMNDAVGNLNAQTLSLGDPSGDFEFRSAIAEYLSQSRGVHCSPDQILIGAGTDYLLMLLCGLFDSEQKIAMENPTYLRAYRIFCGLGRTVNPISVTSTGIDLAVLSASDSSIAYVTPSHQYPLGVVMPVTHRSELLEWAYRSDNRYIIEDDHDSEFRYKGLPIPSLQGMDTKGRVIYLGTFSRAIAPAIRVSYMVLPSELRRRYQERFPYYSSTVSRVDQKILTEFIRGGYLERHLNKMRKTYHQRHDAMLRALRQFGASVTVSGENAGLHLVVSFSGYGTEEEIQKRAGMAGLHLYSLKEHEITPVSTTAPTFLLGFAGVPEEETEEKIARLYLALQHENI
ncbi:MAG: PLP-dependent aminotransferase family protein [Lachnospiraceae bacterium]